jgi:hypothetical protein
MTVLERLRSPTFLNGGHSGGIHNLGSGASQHGRTFEDVAMHITEATEDFCLFGTAEYHEKSTKRCPGRSISKIQCASVDNVYDGNDKALATNKLIPDFQLDRRSIWKMAHASSSLLDNNRD